MNKVFTLRHALLCGAVSAALAGSALAVTPMIATGGGHSMALRSDGTVRTWGWNNSGQLGDGSFQNRTVPGGISAFAGISQIAAGGDHSLAIAEDGNLYLWGDNSFGQLGNTPQAPGRPQQVWSLNGVTAASAGWFHTVAVRHDGTVWSWGLNDRGQLGDQQSALKNQPTPVQVPNFYGAIAAAAGLNFTLILKRDGSVWAWGDGSRGQLGVVYGMSASAATQAATLQTQITTLQGQIAAETDPTKLATLQAQLATAQAALSKLNTTAANFSYNRTIVLGGACGTKETTLYSDICTEWPNQVHFDNGEPLTNIVQIAAGGYHALALDTAGQVWSWGWNHKGQLGRPEVSQADTDTPAKVTFSEAPGRVISIAAGEYHSAVLFDDGSVWAWGYNVKGDLGDGTYTDRSNPRPVLAGNAADSPPLKGVAQIATHAGEHTLALKTDGSLVSWGSNFWGQLGLGYTSFAQNSPILVKGEGGIDKLKLGTPDTSAMDSSARLFGWAERVYASYFPGAKSKTESWGGYKYRKYANGAYLGTKDGRLFYVDPQAAGDVKDLGLIDSWLQQAVSAGY
ncbi:RCC1 domain-containing protein [Parachitinimonas caeni]|uniref:RCC1-like domain-containing protein n=1 Tax=Parachitinimonas caeni TaxID=3031301 RepID=A0ABT7E0N8_9NEIS|nr:hypothetical protein [Parachitinimonas caeni]MDK2124898.1 hypothetical protein [Parachitinimonas caeni]